DTLCKNVVIKNVGSAAFTLTKQFVLSDAVNFSVDTGKLPALVKDASSVSINVCFHPKTEGPYTAGIDWGTDLEASFAHSVKSHSMLTGTATPKEGVKASLTANSFSIHPNPSNGSSVIVTIGEALGVTDKSVRPTGLSVFDVLGREVYRRNILENESTFEIPIRNLPEGVYYVQIGSLTEKFVKVK
ncbi:MAG: T9SS type A sorting domain-containing protein, partial [Candidatus Kapaibacterium sp.]